MLLMCVWVVFVFELELVEEGVMGVGVLGRFLDGVLEGVLVLLFVGIDFLGNVVLMGVVEVGVGFFGWRVLLCVFVIVGVVIMVVCVIFVFVMVGLLMLMGILLDFGVRGLMVLSMGGMVVFVMFLSSVVVLLIMFMMLFIVLMMLRLVMRLFIMGMLEMVLRIGLVMCEIGELESVFVMGVIIVFVVLVIVCMMGVVIGLMVGVLVMVFVMVDMMVGVVCWIGVIICVMIGVMICVMMGFMGVVIVEMVEFMSEVILLRGLLVFLFVCVDLLLRRMVSMVQMSVFRVFQMMMVGMLCWVVGMFMLIFFFEGNGF